MDPLKWTGVLILVGLLAVLGAMLRLITDRGSYAGRCRSKEECEGKHAELMHYRRVATRRSPTSPMTRRTVPERGVP